MYYSQPAHGCHMHEELFFDYTFCVSGKFSYDFKKFFKQIKMRLEWRFIEPNVHLAIWYGENLAIDRFTTSIKSHRIFNDTNQVKWISRVGIFPASIYRMNRYLPGKFEVVVVVINYCVDLEHHSLSEMALHGTASHMITRITIQKSDHPAIYVCACSLLIQAKHN